MNTPAPRRFLALAGLAIGLSATPVAAGSDDAIIRQAIDDFGKRLEAAIPTGYAEGEFIAYNDAGQETDADRDPSCIKEADRKQLADVFANMMLQGLGPQSSCAITANGPDPLRFGLSCTKDAKTISIDASGSSTPTTVTLDVKLKATGEGAPDLGSMHMSARRVRDCVASDTPAS